MNEKWVKWIPVNIPEGNYELIKLEQNRLGIVLVLDDEVNRIVIAFETMLALRSCDESERWKTISEILATEKDFFVKWPMYKGINTEFKSWLTAETFENWNPEEYEHYIFATANDVVDILSVHEPKITVEKML